MSEARTEAGGRRLIPPVAVAVFLLIAAGTAFVARSAADDPAGVQIASGPSGTSASSEATFAFASSDPNASLECRIDGAPFEVCTSPKVYTGLADGDHFFTVRIATADAGIDTASASRAWAVRNLMACTDADEPANFPVYSAGPSVAGLDVTALTRRCDAPEPGAPARANFVTYIYGSCAIVAGSEGCSPPLEVQSWPACERSLADYQLEDGVPYPHENLGELDGVPAYAFNEGTRVELYAGAATVVVFSADPGLIEQAVAALQREPSSKPPGVPQSASDDQTTDLPDPAPGAMAGSLSCA